MRNLLKKAQYYKAYHLILDYIDLSENGLFEEDKFKTSKYIKSGLKNKTLCLWKMKKWNEMEKSCEKYFNQIIDPNAEKKLKEGKIGQNAQVITLTPSHLKSDKQSEGTEQ